MERRASAEVSKEEYLAYCLGLSERFDDPPKVELSLISQIPPTIEGENKQGVGARDIAVSTALQCYAPGVAKMRQRRDEKSISIAESTLKAGHHTTRLHAYYTWHLIGVSRMVTHDIFHSHPFYNSEQQSQRYVEAEMGSFVVPAFLEGEARALFIDSAGFANRRYFDLVELLGPVVLERMRQMYELSDWRITKTSDRLTKKSEKLAYEVARYALPIGQKTIYWHTLSELQLLRLFRASSNANFSDEARYIIARMVEEVRKVDPTIMDELPGVWDAKEVAGYDDRYIRERKNEFDQLLGEKQSVLISYPENLREVLADSGRNTLGVPSSVLGNEDVLIKLLDPKENGFLADTLDTGMLDPLTTVLRQVSIAYATKLSHTADSQRQRHRMTPGATPPIAAMYDGQPDYMTPLVIRENPELKAYYDQTMEQIYENVSACINAGVPREWALLLLPNAHALRVIESGNLFDLLHRLKQRLCYLAQEEIFFVSVEQAQDLVLRIPEAERVLLAPCGIRKFSNTAPRCPEGDRWCGRPVWHWRLDNYINGRLI